MEWTKDNPTVPGFYWIVRNHYGAVVRSLVSVNKDNFGMFWVEFVGADCSKHLGDLDFTHWMGPIQTPDLPKE